MKKMLTTREKMENNNIFFEGTLPVECYSVGDFLAMSVEEVRSIYNKLAVNSEKNHDIMCLIEVSFFFRP